MVSLGIPNIRAKLPTYLAYGVLIPKFSLLIDDGVFISNLAIRPAILDSVRRSDGGLVVNQRFAQKTVFGAYMDETQVFTTSFATMPKGVDHVRNHSLVRRPSGVDDKVDYTRSASLLTKIKISLDRLTLVILDQVLHCLLIQNISLVGGDTIELRDDVRLFLGSDKSKYLGALECFMLARDELC